MEVDPPELSENGSTSTVSTSSGADRANARLNALEEIEKALPGTFPEDVHSIAKILRSSGVSDCEPAVVNQLLEFMHRYVCEVLADSLLFCEHAGRRDAIQADDVQLAIKYRVDHAFSAFSQPPSIDFLREMAQDINIIRLPPINKRFGVMLPPDHFCLNETNYQVVVSKKGTAPATSTSSSSSSTAPTSGSGGSGSSSSSSSEPASAPMEDSSAAFLEEIARMTAPRPKPPSRVQFPVSLSSTITSMSSGLPSALPLNFNT
ncbi:transcription initiation factor iid, 31kd subunit protein [Acanthamoeba castellanii str. Neff]|uniref:Transcription initiation factor iid, 31kd subunit protein n=1 Tax=Acanthamoeba castellanii (strain ATCC 30010 / Neff) TaxID=1257118 RepID=L8GEQ1_ACACF|nr:transcription initiation factor iid, 31kd subunit protein [Acanthamoeba castellanii str. Neff]ELR11198.1 transcription initiation factor iid, 31kd subunit protein [Acanthamoeba castellanii str. Neff]